MRLDLLQLTDEDLVALSNRGNVRRARTEIDAGALTVELVEAEDGRVDARWSDGAVCTLPSGLSIARGRCSCPADAPCRHLLRTVMAYRASHADTRTIQPTDEPVRPSVVALPRGLEARARKQFDEGQLFELTRSHKPIARCHSLGVVIRFLVPGDPNHAVCDCGTPAPCEHGLMALWAFERLAEGIDSGLVDTRTAPYPVPHAALDAVDAALAEWIRIGVADAPGALVDRARTTEATCRKAGLAWTAEALDELLALKVAYDARDARFDAARLAAVVGELVARGDVTRADRGLVPPLFVRGTASDRTVDVGVTRLVGLGCGVRPRRASLQLTAFAQSEETGQVLAVVREVPHAPGDTRSLAHAGTSRVAKGISLADLSAGRTLAHHVKRTAGGVLTFGRSPASCQPQGYLWESLRAPALAEGFAEVEAHLAQMPPMPLRPRRIAEDVFVVPLRSVRNAGFDPTAQAVKAQLVDELDGIATLVHPYHVRAAAGLELLLSCLLRDEVRFVAGRMRAGASGLMVEPVGLVVERRGTRSLINPWLDEASSTTTSTAHETTADLDPSRFLRDDLAVALGELLVSGIEGITEPLARRWRDRAAQAEALGFQQLPAQLRALAGAPDVARLTALAAMIAFAEPA